MRATCALALAAAVLAGCTRQPTDDELQPPPTWRAGIMGTLDQARRDAARLSQRAGEYLKRSPPPAGSAPALAAAIRYSEQQARRGRERRIPPHAREALEHFFPEALIEEVRWTLPGQRPDLGSFLAGWYFQEGAVTLGDTIVFSDRELARNVWFWAHELVHVEQYRRWGVDGFAQRYVADWRTLEAEATAKADRITAILRARKAAAEAQAQAEADAAPLPPAADEEPED